MADRTAISKRRRTRERFLEGRDVAGSVRPEIDASWRRSQLSGVVPDRLPEIRVGEFDRENRLLRAAAPILDRLSDQIADLSMSLLLTDGNARILERRVGVPNLQAQLDTVTAVPGAAYTEETVGTNGLGTTVETRRPFIVSGGEHFAEPLRDLTCAAAPILHPITGHLEGVVDITSRSEDASGLMLTVACGAAAAVSQRLYEAASSTERALLERFLAAARRSSAPLVSVNSELIITNAAAARLLEPSDHVRLWERVAGSSSTTFGIDELALANGATYRAKVVPVVVGGRPVGALIHLARPAAQTRTRRPARAQPELVGLVGRSAPWHALCDEVAKIARAPLDVVVVGEDGTGKLSVARALHDVNDPAGAPPVILDASLALADEHAWFAQLGRCARQPGTLIVRHVESLAPAQASTLAAICEGAAGRLVVTADERWLASAPRRLVDRFPARVNVPALRERLDDLPWLVSDLLRRHAEDANAVRVQPEVLQLLARHRWPGNIRELENLIRHVLSRRPRGDVTVADLPVQYRAPTARRDLTVIQQLERQAILQALGAANGNKHAAAARLGISRSTLYRRVEAYQIGLGEHVY